MEVRPSLARAWLGRLEPQDARRVVDADEKGNIGVRNPRPSFGVGVNGVDIDLTSGAAQSYYDSDTFPNLILTLTLSAIFTAPALYLHIEGEKKRAVLDGAQRDPRSALPIRSVLSGAPVTPTLFWSP